MGQKKENGTKSLFLYTALIFIVAIVLIIIAFFGQAKLEKSQPSMTDIPVSSNSITERASILSDENKNLVEKNIELNEQIASTKKNLADLNAQLDLYKKGHETNDKLLSANGFCSKKMYKEARDILSTIDTTTFTDDQKILYNSLVKLSK